jgi:monoamine oxidase
VDVVIIGAGLAGLSAARALVERGCDVVLLEARTRLGGRVWTLHETESPAAIELGAEWCEPRGELARALERGGATLESMRGKRVVRTPEGWDTSDEFPDDMGSVLKRVAVRRGPDMSLLDALTVNGEDIDRRDVQALLGYVQGFHAADPARVSMQWLLRAEQVQSAGMSDRRTFHGLDAAVQAFARDIQGGCDVRLKSAVRKIEWRAGEAIVHVDGDAPSRFTTPAIIVTVPLPLLGFARPGSRRAPSQSQSAPDAIQAERRELRGGAGAAEAEAGGTDAAVIEFSPTLPEKHEAASLLAMGHAMKVVLRFREPFWKANRALAKMGFLFTFDQAFPTWWPTETSGGALLNAWSGGPRVMQLGADSDAIISRAIESLAHALDLPRSVIERDLVGHYFHDWRADPFARGAYTYVCTGGFDAHATLAQPVQDTLFFAGEATCGDGMNATMEGAIQSGLRAAKQVAEHLERVAGALR